jgi:hypothetical protein
LRQVSRDQIALTRGERLLRKRGQQILVRVSAGSAAELVNYDSG